MTNFEKLKQDIAEGDINLLADFILSNAYGTCKRCAFVITNENGVKRREKCRKMLELYGMNGLPLTCQEGIKRWLEQEYKEEE